MLEFVIVDLKSSFELEYRGCLLTESLMALSNSSRKMELFVDDFLKLKTILVSVVVITVAVLVVLNLSCQFDVLYMLL